MKDKPFALIGIHVGGTDVAQTKKIMDKEKLPWRTFVDAGQAGAGPIAVKWNHCSTPSFYVIDQKGVIRYKWTGSPGEKAIDDALNKLIRLAENDGKQP